MPAISVVLPFRDAGRYLSEAVQSVLLQGFTDFELLAVDDGSRDDSVRVIEQAGQLDPRVRLLRSEGRGLPAALNIGIAAAKGRYVARMDGDDVALPRRFALQFAALENDPRLVVVGSAVEQIDSHGRQLETAWYPSSPATIRVVLAGGRCCLCHPATMIRRDALLAVGGYRTSVPLTEDFDLWLRLSKIGDLRNLGRRLLRYRLHGGSVALRRTHEQITSLLRSAVLNRDDLAERDLTFVESCTDLRVLVGLLHPNEDPASVFLGLTDWYVENAAMAGEHRAARRLAAQLARLAPRVREEDRDLLEQRLRQSAALAAAFRHDWFDAMRYLFVPGWARRRRSLLWRSVFCQPAVAVRIHQPPGGDGIAAGCLDRIGLFEERRTLVLEGWLPVTNDTLPRHLALVLPCMARIASFRILQRPDVAREMGVSHLHAGFRLVAELDRAVDPATEKLSAWAGSTGRPWRRLYDESAVLEVDDI